MDLKKNPELIPLIEWWEKDGKSTVIMLLVAAIAVGGWYGWKAHRASVKAAAADAVANAYTTAELEEASTKFAGEKVGGALKIRLAKSYYDAGNYQAALDCYDALAKDAPDGFADIPAVGRAQCLEALKKYAEAVQEFDAFAKTNPDSFLALTAKLGAARSLAQSGKKDEALKRLADMKKNVKDDEMAKARIEATETAVKRLAKK